MDFWMEQRDLHPKESTREYWRLFPKAMCISGTAVSLTAFKHFFTEIPARPMAVAINLDIEGDLPGASEKMIERERQRQKDIRAMNLPFGGWRSHLVPIVGGTIIDPTAAQYSVPSRGAYLPDTVIIPGIGAQNRVSKRSVEFRYTTHFPENAVTAVLKYRQEPHNFLYRALPLWIQESNTQFAEEVIEKVEEAWEEPGTRDALRALDPRPGAGAQQSHLIMRADGAGRIQPTRGGVGAKNNGPIRRPKC